MSSVCIAFGYGCSRAEVDIAVLFEYFQANGWAITDSLESADLILVMSCGFSAKIEAESTHLLKSVEARRKPGSKVVVIGCLAGMAPENLRERFGVDLVPPRTAEKMDEVINAAVKIGDIADPLSIQPYVDRAKRHFRSAERHGLIGGFLIDSGLNSAFKKLGWKRDASYLDPKDGACTLRVARGCPGECAYCAIRLACGPLYSKPLETVLEEFDTGIARGYTEFRLVAQDLGAYGQDRGTNVAEMLRGIFSRPGKYKLTLIDLNIRWLVLYENEIIDLIARHASRIRHIEVPLQSGSNAVLKRMKRGHTAENAERVLRALRASAPRAVMGTHALVGFPGETEADFQATVGVLRSIKFDRVDVFDFTARPGTEAQAMAGKIPDAVIRSRSRRLRSEFCGRMSGIEYWVRHILPSLFT